VRVLTFNSHQPYVHLLASVLPWTFGVVTPRLPSGRIKEWEARIRPLPVTVRLFTSVDAALQAGSWDWVLAHNVSDLVDTRAMRAPKVFLVHGTLSGRILEERSAVDRDRYVADLRRLLDRDGALVVYISDLKRDDWGLPGRVIRQSLDPSAYGAYRGDVRGILQVSNHLRARGEMLGYEAHRAVCEGLPALVLGNNRGLPDGRASRSWEDLKECYRSYRLYLHTARYPYEDGFNLAVLEAMATGMPIATLRHPTSPIEDGVEGVVGSDPEDLRARVVRLLDDPDEARRCGERARAKLLRAFPLDQFRQGWKDLAAAL
jgi:hypothetical protein